MFYNNEKEWHVYLHVEECYGGGWVVFERDGLNNQAKPLDNGNGVKIFNTKKEAKEHMDSCKRINLRVRFDKDKS